MKKSLRDPAMLAMSLVGLLTPDSHSLATPVLPDSSQNRRILTFADRVAYQYAIEEIYWRHRIWPIENSRSKPSLDEVMSRTQIERKVEDYLRNSQALATWQRPISAQQL